MSAFPKLIGNHVEQLLHRDVGVMKGDDVSQIVGTE